MCEVYRLYFYIRYLFVHDVMYSTGIDVTLFGNVIVTNLSILVSALSLCVSGSGSMGPAQQRQHHERAGRKGDALSVLIHCLSDELRSACFRVCRYFLLASLAASALGSMTDILDTRTRTQPGTPLRHRHHHHPS